MIIQQECQQNAGFVLDLQFWPFKVYFCF